MTLEMVLQGIQPDSPHSPRAWQGMTCQQATLSKLFLVQVQATGSTTVQSVEPTQDHAWQLSSAEDIAY